MSELTRVPEPELMASPSQVASYAAPHAGEADAAFRMWLMMSGVDLRGVRAVDLGCGPAALPIQLCQGFDGLRITGVDASGAMVERARADVATAGLGERVDIIRAAIPWAPLHAGSYGAVFSHGLLHHLADPRDLWREARRLAAPGAALLVMDLIRPASEDDLESAIRAAANDADERLLHDYHASLRAAYTFDEVAEQLATTGLSYLAPRAVGDRLMAIFGRLAAEDGTTRSP